MTNSVQTPVSVEAAVTFWEWFVENEQRIYSVETNQEAVFRQIESRLNQVNSDLCFAFGAVGTDGRRTFEISAGGIKSAFPAVEFLYDQAPKLPRWTWVKYRQPDNKIYDISYRGRTMKAADVRWLMAAMDDVVGIRLYLVGYTESQHEFFGSVGFLYLDSILGEYAVATKVGAIDFKPAGFQGYDHARPLIELSECFQSYFQSDQA